MSLFTVILEQHTNMAILFTDENLKIYNYCLHIYVKIYPQLDTNRHHTCKNLLNNLFHSKHVHNVSQCTVHSRHTHNRVKLEEINTNIML